MFFMAASYVSEVVEQIHGLAANLAQTLLQTFRWVCPTLALVRQLIAVRRGNGVVVQVARFGCCVRWHWVEEALLESQ